MPLQRCVEHARVNINEAVRLMENSVRQRCAYVVSSHEKCERIKANRTTNEVPVVNEWIWQRKLVKPKPLKIESFFFFFFFQLDSLLHSFCSLLFSYIFVRCSMFVWFAVRLLHRYYAFGYSFAILFYSISSNIFNSHVDRLSTFQYALLVKRYKCIVAVVLL